MNNGGKTAALVGISAIGGILAYYGYNQYAADDGDTDIDDSISQIKEKENTVNTSIIQQKGSRLDTIKEIAENQDNTEKTDKWSEFWSDEYNKIKEEKSSPSVVEDVSPPPVVENISPPPVVDKSKFMISESIPGPSKPK